MKGMAYSNYMLFNDCRASYMTTAVAAHDELHFGVLEHGHGTAPGPL